MSIKQRTYPGWPRGLSRELAAIYVGISTMLLDQMVADGRMPPPVQVNRRRLFDRHKIDQAFDLLSGADDEKYDPYVQAVINSGSLRASPYDQWKRSQRPISQAVSVRDPDELRASKVYTPAEWEKAIRSRPLGVREKRALGAFFHSKDAPLSYVKGGSFDACERLVARGLLQVAEDRGERMPFHRISAEGERMWQQLAPQEGIDF